MATELTIPEDITPRDFYQSLLANLFSARGPNATLKGFDTSVRAVVSGDGGGTWTIRLRDGAFSVARGPEANPFVTLHQTREDWQVTITKGVGKLLARLGDISSNTDAAAALSQAASGFKMPSITFGPEKLKRLSTTKGSFHFDITGAEGGRTIRLSVVFNETEKPSFAVTIKAEDYRAMSAGTLPPQQAFMQGKIQISGDVPFAMQLGMQFLQP
ncbi:MAG: SCP2 sterol-binding domain-containing protein [Deltaproteobacteria bacterium]|nr:SCP2 sterol-binding domain-containing protein [Deltaproteobacteria bacterium]